VAADNDEADDGRRDARASVVDAHSDHFAVIKWPLPQ
jgi:hypothetical protein